MAKPVYYLWKNKDTNKEDFERLIQKYHTAGFQVVIYNNTSDDKNIQKALLAIIKNHL